MSRSTPRPRIHDGAAQRRMMPSNDAQRGGHSTMRVNGDDMAKAPLSPSHPPWRVPAVTQAPFVHTLELPPGAVMVVTFAEGETGAQSPASGTPPFPAAAPSPPLALDADSPMFALEDGEEPADGWCVAARDAEGTTPVWEGNDTPGAAVSPPGHSLTALAGVCACYLATPGSSSRRDRGAQSRRALCSLKSPSGPWAPRGGRTATRCVCYPTSSHACLWACARL